MLAFSRVLGVARQHAAWILLAFVSMVMVALSTVFAYNLIRPIYDQVLKPEVDGGGDRSETMLPIPSDGLIAKLDTLAAQAQQLLRRWVGQDRTIILVLVLIAIAAKNLFTFLSRYAVAQLGLATIRDLRNLVFDALLGQAPGYFHKTSSGLLIARVVNDVQLISEALAERFGDLAQDLLTVVLLLVYVFALNPGLALATLVLAPLLLAPVIHFSRRLRHRSRQSQERMGDLTSILSETITGMRVVQAFTSEESVASRFRRATHQHFRANLRARTIQAANAPVMEVVGAAGAVALIAYAASEIASAEMTLGDFSAFLVAIYGTYNPIKRLNKFNLALQQASVAAQRVFEVVDAPVTIRDQPQARTLQGVGEGVEFDRVGFAYQEQSVLENFSLKIPCGHTLALVGPSGAGKSTVAQLIPRFWDAQQGAVLIGGNDVREVTLASLRAQIGLVTQETMLFNDTVRANIGFGETSVSPTAVEAAARAAFAHEFISELPAGYDTVVGEAGLCLSGGQRQRLAIARALYKDRPLLILDEATSALDPEAERLVQQALANLMRGRTTLVIAHRLATVRSADTIVVIDRGRIVEQGTHQELIAAAGVYRRMVEMQELSP